MGIQTKDSTNIPSAIKPSVIIFSLLHIITISLCGYLLHDGMKIKEELYICKFSSAKSDLTLNGTPNTKGGNSPVYLSDHDKAPTSPIQEIKIHVEEEVTRRKRQAGVTGPYRESGTANARGTSRVESSVGAPGRSGTPGIYNPCPIRCRGSRRWNEIPDWRRPCTPGNRGPPGARGARGPPGTNGHTGAPGVQGPPGEQTPPGEQRPTTTVPSRASRIRPGRPGPQIPDSTGTAPEVTYIHWGKFGCTLGQQVYGGYIVGFNNRSTSLLCAPTPNDLTSDSTSLPSGPKLSAIRFNLQGIRDPSDIASFDKRLVRCAFCHASRREVFTVIGSTSCNFNSGWTVVYSGYLMAAESGGSTSEPICMDRRPVEADNLQTATQTPELKLVRSGRGIWSEDKLMTCAVCTRQRNI